MLPDARNRPLLRDRALLERGNGFTSQKAFSRMRGRVLFRHGPHLSRLGYLALPTSVEEAEFRLKMERLWVEIKKITSPFPVSEKAFRALNISILIAISDYKRSKTGTGTGAAQDTSTRVTHSDRLAQLTALDKIIDNKQLVEALRNIDDRTLAVIDATSKSLMAAEIDIHGKYVDDDGEEWNFPTSLKVLPHVPKLRKYVTLSNGIDGLREELYARGFDASSPASVVAGINSIYKHSSSSALKIEALPSSPIPAYLPMGIDGLRSAIKIALKETLEVKDRRGNRRKEEYDALGRACHKFWEETLPSRFRGKAWQSGAGEKSSKLLEFSKLVFATAGFPLSPITLAEVMNGKRGK